MSINNAFIKKIRITYASLNTPIRNSAAHIPFKFALNSKIFTIYFPLILESLTAQCGN